LNPTILPSRSPTNPPTYRFNVVPWGENTGKTGNTGTTNVFTEWTQTEDEEVFYSAGAVNEWVHSEGADEQRSYSPAVSAQCYMTSSDDGKVRTEKVGLRNITLHLDEIGVTLQNTSAATNFFGMLLRMEFVNFGGYMSGKIWCDLYLDMEILNEAFSNFTQYDILFMVSREEFQTGSAGITEYIRSVKKVWRRTKDVLDLIYSYTFEESTFDGVSDFTAEVHLVDEKEVLDAMLNIETYPYPTVVHYVSFERYSYVDWLADMGGFYTLALGLFFVLSTQITKLANRRDIFQKRQGILPAISLTHRNAEELSQLRSLVLAALGVTEEAYFSGDYEDEVCQRLSKFWSFQMNQQGSLL